ncbi:MAG: 4-alpha-glucanotransferase [Pseudomonadota bacterium]|nr:4-alpha-glucanotransferase [Pseudomonadota bacterium]
MNPSAENPLPHPLSARRRAGLLLHPTSLPGEGESGDLGESAHRFVDVLAGCGMTVWQMLPLGPTHSDRSPYQCLSAHAGNPRLISRRRLEEWGWLGSGLSSAEHDWLGLAQAGFIRAAGESGWQALEDFRREQAFWLEDYALYQALRQEHDGAPWWQWPQPLRDRDAEALAQARERLGTRLARVHFEQFVFFRQWQDLRQHAARQGILLFGDVPIFVAHDSADVWTCRRCFSLGEDGQPLTVAGVPPDFFSATGQRWGNPLFRWEVMQADGFRWWIERMRTQLRMFDLLRIDHFRGFESYWEIPAQETTAVNGHWVAAPGEALFRALNDEFGALPLVVEDLGAITDEVRALRRKLSLPGMNVLQFAFDGSPDNSHLPHRHDANSVVYTGTHDNDTTLGWYDVLPADARTYVMDYLGMPGDPMPWALIRAALASVSALAMLPMQDVLGLGASGRMNTPGTTTGNWQWRFSWDQFDDRTASRLRHLVRLYGRLAGGLQRP